MNPIIMVNWHVKKYLGIIYGTKTQYNIFTEFKLYVHQSIIEVNPIYGKYNKTTPTLRITTYCTLTNL